MITQEQIKELQGRVETLRKCVDIDGKRSEVQEKEKKSQAPDFWNDPKEAEAFLKGISSVKSWVTSFDEARSAVDDLEVLLELEPDSPDTDAAYANAVSLVEKLELRNPTALTPMRHTLMPYRWWRSWSCATCSAAKGIPSGPC